MCIRHTLVYGRRYGLASGLGAATADACYGVIAAFGLHSISSLLLNQTVLLNLFGGLFLTYLGYKTLCARPVILTEKAIDHPNIWSAYGSVFALTLTNPLTILSFLGIFAGLGFADAVGDFVAAVTMVSGVFSGSALWWFVLSSGVSLLSVRFNAKWMVWVNRVSGVIILYFAARILLSIFNTA